MTNLCETLLSGIRMGNLPHLFGSCARQLAKIYIEDFLTSEFIKKFSKKINTLRPAKSQEYIKETLYGMLIVMNCLINKTPKREYDWICRQLAHDDDNPTPLALKISKMRKRRPSFFTEHQFLGATELIIYIKYGQ